MNPIHKYIVFVVLIAGTLGCDSKSHLPSINIVQQDTIKWQSKEQCIIEYNDKTGNHTYNAQIKYRGGLSSRYNKHSFTLELDKKHRLAGLPKEDDWILNASYIDKTFMRHTISYDLYHQMNVNNVSAKSSYISLYINGQYKGLYILVEEINASKVGLNKQDNMSMLFKDPPLLYTTRIKPQEPDNYYQQKYPKITTADMTSYIESFKLFIFNSSDIDFDAGITDWVDIDNIIDWHLLLLLTYNGDGIMKNFYLYKKDSFTPFKIAIWDYDHSFGRDGDNELNMMDRPLRIERSILFVRLLNTENLNYKKLLSDRYHELRNNDVFSKENIDHKLDQNHQIIKDELDLNFALWPVDSKWYYDANDYNKEVQIIKNFVILRLNQLDKQFDFQQKGN
ncbi:MAG: CotH kinase family protein [Saprospiraceae bacterium]